MAFKPQVFALLSGSLAFLTLASGIANAQQITVDDSAETETVITLRVELCPDPKDNPATEKKEGPTTQEVQDFIDAKLPGVTAIWNSCDKQFRINRDAPRKTVRFVFDVTVIDDCKAERDPTKKRMKVHLGRAPARLGIDANATNLWMENTPKTIAHEFGHFLGLDEEYRQFGPTRANLMGRDETPMLEPYHVMTALFMNYGNPDGAEERRRANMQFCLRSADQKSARAFAADNGITEDEYNAYADQFTANNSQMQPAAPK